VADVVDAAFETAVQSRDVPGTYPCIYNGTVGYIKSGATYTFTVNNCDTAVGGRRVMLQSGSLRVENPVVQTTSAGYFLTSAAATFINARVMEAGVSSTFGGSASLSSTVTSPTSAVATTTGASVSVERAGRTDNYSNVNVTASVTLTAGNLITSGTLTVSSPRAPGVLTLSAATPSLTVTATDNSQSVISTTDYVNYTLQYLNGGTVLATSTGSANSGPLAEAINRALQ
jgi:hypothetical protein